MRLRRTSGSVHVGIDVDDAVAAGLLLRHGHHRQRRATGVLVGLDELADARALGLHHVVREDDGEGLMADQLLGHQHRVPQAQLLLLAHIADLRHVPDLAHPAQHLDVALGLQHGLQLEAVVEMVLDGPLLAAGDDDDLLDPGGHGLFDRVLDDRLVHQRQHLLGLCLGGGQEAGPPARGREHCFANAHRSSTAGAGTGLGLGGRRGCLRRESPECTAEAPVGSGLTVMLRAVHSAGLSLTRALLGRGSAGAWP